MVKMDPFKDFETYLVVFHRVGVPQGKPQRNLLPATYARARPPHDAWQADGPCMAGEAGGLVRPYLFIKLSIFSVKYEIIFKKCRLFGRINRLLF